MGKNPCRADLDDKNAPGAGGIRYIQLTQSRRRAARSCTTDGEDMKTILVVDDSAVCREPMAAILESHGYRVLRAADGVEGLEVARAEEPELILLDIVMPRMDGLTMLEVLRNDPAHKDRPVILVTGTTDRSCILKARALGVQGYLLKTGFSVDEMLGRVRACLAKPEGTSGESRAPGSEALSEKV